MKTKKRALTLLEIMIVIFLIGLIGSVIGVNMKGSMEEGKAFKSRKAKEQIADILMLEVARGVSIEEVVKNPQIYLENSGLVKNPETFLNDGWGTPFEIKVGSGKNSGNVVVKSAKLTAYDKKKNEKLGKASTENEDDEN